LHTLYSLLNLYDKPYGLNYIGRYTFCKGIRLTFPQYVIGAVHIGTDLAPIFGAVQAVSSSDPLSAKDMLFLIVGFVVGNGIKVKEAGFAGIALFSDFYLYANQSGFYVNMLMKRACGMATKF
jgi:hypothetical protein